MNIVSFFKKQPSEVVLFLTIFRTTLRWSWNSLTNALHFCQCFQVVLACLAGGAHHIDISGEPQFLEKIQLKYHKEAEAKGVYVIGACGFDSIPSDMGRALVHKEVRTYAKFLLQYNLGATSASQHTWCKHYIEYLTYPIWGSWKPTFVDIKKKAIFIIKTFWEL